MEFRLLIKNGTIVDGTGAPAFDAAITSQGESRCGPSPTPSASVPPRG